MLIYILINFSFLFGARALNYALQYKTYSEMGISFFIFRFGYFSLYGGIIYGKITDSWFSIPLPIKEQARLSQSTFASSLFGNISMRVYSAQLMEGIGALLIVIILFLLRKKLLQGETFLLSAMLFSFLRFIVIFYRQLPYSDFIKLWFYPTIYILIIVYTFRMLIKIHFKKHIINES